VRSVERSGRRRRLRIALSRARAVTFESRRSSPGGCASANIPW
jgi:hypothetical protein